MTDLTPIASKLARITRKLGDKNPNEKAEAWKALVRTLDTFGADFNDLGDRIEHAGNGALNEIEMQEIFDAGIQEGIKRAGQGQARPGSLPQFPPPHDMALYCYQHIADCNEWETKFITNMVSLTRRGYPLSTKRQEKLETLYLKLGGRI